MSYRMVTKDGVVIYRHAPLKAEAKPRPVDVSAILSNESNLSQDEGPIQYGRPRNDSSHVGRFAYRPTKRRLYVLFASGEEYVYENVSRRLFEGLMDAKSCGEYFHRYVNDPEKHPFKKIR